MPTPSRKSGAVPERLKAAVEILDLRPDDAVMEIGCGRGVAAALICERLTQGRLLAIDRSATAVAAARECNADAVAAGRADFRHTALADVVPAGPGTYAKILAVNVNLFWTGPATRELAIVAQLLRPGGQLVLCFEPPPGVRSTRLRDTLLGNLRAVGYRAHATTRPLARGELLVVTARTGR
jgi:trans-aconitate methyltransferase